MLWSTGTGFGTLLHGYHDGGLGMPAAGGNGNLIFAQREQYRDVMSKELSVAAPRRRTDIASTMAWDPAMILIEALDKLGPHAAPERNEDSVEKLHS